MEDVDGCDVVSVVVQILTPSDVVRLTPVDIDREQSSKSRERLHSSVPEALTGTRPEMKSFSIVMSSRKERMIEAVSVRASTSGV